MPIVKGKRYNKVMAKRRAKKARVAPVRIVTRSNNITQLRSIPIPMVWKTTLRYCTQTISLNPGAAGAPAQQLFAANGLYDPDITGTGHQPMGFDQFMVIYSTYTVTASKIELFAYNKDSGTSQILTCIAGYFTGVVYADKAIEQGEATWVHMGPRGSNKEIATLSNKWNLKSQAGNAAGVGEPVDGGSSGANPTALAYFNVIADPNNATDTAAIDIFAVIDYDVTFSLPNIMNQS